MANRPTSSRKALLDRPRPLENSRLAKERASQLIARFDANL